MKTKIMSHVMRRTWREIAEKVTEYKARLAVQADYLAGSREEIHLRHAAALLELAANALLKAAGETGE